MRNDVLGTLVYAPVLHRELLPVAMPVSVVPLWPGLPLPRNGSWHKEEWLVLDLPYTAAEAAACVADIERLDESSLSGFSVIPRRQQAGTQEKKALENFAKTGLVPETVSAEPDSNALRCWAQRMLLLGWVQEARALEVRALMEQYRHGANRLSAHLGQGVAEAIPGLGDEDSLTVLLEALQELVPDDPDAVLPSWRFMLEVFGLLLPPDAVLVTADQRMLRSLRERGLDQPCEIAQLPDDLRPLAPALSCTTQPLWKLIERNAPLADRPWLDRTQTVLLLDTDTLAEDA